MPEKVFDRIWTLGGSTTATTGAGTAATLAGTLPTEWTVYFETPGSTLSTATVRFEAASDSTSPFARVGSTGDLSLSSASMTTISFTGPHTCVRPYLVTLGSTHTVVKIRAIGV